MAVTSLGATPVGVDVREETFNIDPERVREALTRRTKAIVPVHLFGRPADLEAIAELADQDGVVVIEDAAQAHGARLNGRRVDSLARAAAFSFYPTKNLGALGDGGAVTTDDDDLAEEVRMLRMYGWRERSVSEIFGFNSRLDEVQAALLRVKLRRPDEHNERRRRIAAAYAELLADVDAVMPSVPDRAEPVWHVYATGVADRAIVQRRLAEARVETLVITILFPISRRRIVRADGVTATIRSQSGLPRRS